MVDFSEDSFRTNRLLKKLSKKKLHKKKDPFQRINLSNDSYVKLNQSSRQGKKPNEKFPRIVEKTGKQNPYVKYQKEWKALKWINPELRKELKAPGEIPRLVKNWRWKDEEES